MTGSRTGDKSSDVQQKATGLIGRLYLSNVSKARMKSTSSILQYLQQRLCPRCTLSPVWPPRTPERAARYKAEAPKERAGPGSRSSAPPRTGRGRRSKTRCSSKTWPAESCTSSPVWTSSSEASGASGWRGHCGQKGRCCQRGRHCPRLTTYFSQVTFWDSDFLLSDNWPANDVRTEKLKKKKNNKNCLNIKASVKSHTVSQGSSHAVSVKRHDCQLTGCESLFASCFQSLSPPSWSPRSSQFLSGWLHLV